MVSFIANPSIARKRAYGQGMLKGALSPIQVNQGNPFGTVDPYGQMVEKIGLAIMAGRQNRQAANEEALQKAGRHALGQALTGSRPAPPTPKVDPKTGFMASLSNRLLGDRVTPEGAYRSMVGDYEGMKTVPKELIGTLAGHAGADTLEVAKTINELGKEAGLTNPRVVTYTIGGVEHVVQVGEKGKIRELRFTADGIPILGDIIDPESEEGQIILNTQEADGEGTLERLTQSRAELEVATNRREAAITLPKERMLYDQTIENLSLNTKLLEDMMELAKDKDSALVGLKGYAGGIAAKFGMPTAIAVYNSMLETLDANIAFFQLKRMREGSKTGGALGQIAVKELEMLAATLGRLKIGDIPRDQILKQLRTVHSGLNSIMTKYQKDYNLYVLENELDEEYLGGIFGDRSEKYAGILGENWWEAPDPTSQLVNFGETIRAN